MNRNLNGYSKKKPAQNYTLHEKQERIGNTEQRKQKQVWEVEGKLGILSEM